MNLKLTFYNFKRQLTYFFLFISTLVFAQSDLVVTKTINNTTPLVGNNVIFTITARNDGTSNNNNVTVNDLLPSGYTYVSNTATTGTYNSTTGVWTIGNLNNGASATLTITATVQSSGIYTNTATINTSSGISDPNLSNNVASVTPLVQVDSDGDGVADNIDLDDDNDGILDTVENSVVCGICDTDNDGTPNYLDLDSDGDGCADAVEGGDNVTQAMLDGNGRINVAANGTTTPVVVDAQGVPVITNTGSTFNVDGQAQGQTVNQAYTVNPAVVAGTASSHQTIASGTSPLAITLTGSTGTIQWQSSTDNVTFANISGATSASYSPGTMTSTTYYRAVVSSLGGCSVNTNSVVITVFSNTDSDGDGVPDYLDLDDDNDGILDTVENSVCGIPNPNIPPGNGVITRTIFDENFGTMSTANGTTSVTLAGVGTGATTTYSYYEAIAGTIPTLWTDGSGPPYSLYDGRYTVFNNIKQTALWAGTEWKTIGDHTNGGTTPTGGRMLIVNSSHSPGEFYRRTLSNVVEGAPINASLWVMNINVTNGVIKPNVTVKFEQPAGNVIHSFDTGDISNNSQGDVNDWKFFKNTTHFFPPTSQPIDVVFVNNAPGGTGNDLAIDDIIVYQSLCDTDNDGIPDYLDTDSDNDGCPDATEGANHYTTTATLTGGSNGGSSGNLGTTVNTNGIPIPPGTVGGSTGQATTTGVLTPVRINAGTTPPVAVSGTVGTTVNLTSNATAESATTWATTTPFAPNYTTLGNATSGLTYSWTKNGTTIAGATSATLSLTNVSLADAGTYEVTIKHSGNYCATTSNSTVFTLAICYNDAATGTAGVDTKHGITLLNRAGADNGNWPMIRKSAHTVLESNTKGFVITRATTAQIMAIVSPQDGMMVYDTDAKCLKIYTVDDVTPANSAWSCFSTPTCP